MRRSKSSAEQLLNQLEFAIDSVVQGVQVRGKTYGIGPELIDGEVTVEAAILINENRDILAGREGVPRALGAEFASVCTELVEDAVAGKLTAMGAELIANRVGSVLRAVKTPQVLVVPRTAEEH